MCLEVFIGQPLTPPLVVCSFLSLSEELFHKRVKVKEKKILVGILLRDFLTFWPRLIRHVCYTLYLYISEALFFFPPLSCQWLGASSSWAGRDDAHSRKAERSTEAIDKIFVHHSIIQRAISCMCLLYPGVNISQLCVYAIVVVCLVYCTSVTDF